MPDFLDPPSGKYFAEDRQQKFGMPLSQFGGDPKDAWQAAEEKYKPVAALWEAEPGPFLAGDKPSWADFEVAAYIAWIYEVDKSSYGRLVKMHPAFGKLYDAMQKYA
jgi:glutathione S-transferase